MATHPPVRLAGYSNRRWRLTCRPRVMIGMMRNWRRNGFSGLFHRSMLLVRSAGLSAHDWSRGTFRLSHVGRPHGHALAAKQAARAGHPKRYGEGEGDSNSPE